MDIDKRIKFSHRQTAQYTNRTHGTFIWIFNELPQLSSVDTFLSIYS